MTLEELVKSRRSEILEIAARHGAGNVRVFGSVARGEADGKSDVDFIVDLAPDRSLLDLANLLADLRDLLGHEVHVVTEDSIYWLLKRRILKEAVPI